LYITKINQNLLSVALLLGKDYKMSFENKFCVIKDAQPKSTQSSYERQKFFFKFDERGVDYKE